MARSGRNAQTGSEGHARFRRVRAHYRLAAFLASAVASAIIGAAFSPSTIVAVKDAVAGGAAEQKQKPPLRPNILPSQLVSAERIGLFKVEESGRAEDAFLAYGDPSSKTLESKISCRMHWQQLGLEIYFYNLGANDPCGYQGHFCRATINGRQWATSRGLQVGESVRRLWELYPEAKQLKAQGATINYVLEPGTYPCGPDAHGLEAVTAGGRIGGFIVTFAAGGD